MVWSGASIVGPAAGQYCYMIARMLGAKRVFELGSGYGYSTLWFAKAVRDNGGGEVYHTVWDEGLSTRARRNWPRIRAQSIRSRCRNLAAHSAQL